MLLAAGFVPSFVSLSALKSRALRRGVWFRVSPAARALIDAAILYLKRGGRIKSPALAEVLRKAAEEVLRPITPVRVLAKAVGYSVARRLGVEVDEERAVALGLQWLNTPKRWRRDVAAP
jgi:ribosomal protein S7